MKKTLLTFLILCSIAPLAAENQQVLNSHYQPEAVCKRLSYDNFRDIRLMTVPIMNFGDGESEFNRLVDKYAQATAFYFNREYDKSAQLFSQNEKEILSSAMKICEQYKNDTMTLQQKVIAENVRFNIKRSLNGEEPNPIAEKFLRQGTESVRRANDLMVRSRPIQAIPLYRNAKESFFEYYRVMGIKFEEEYEKHITDNRNTIFKGREKSN